MTIALFEHCNDTTSITDRFWGASVSERIVPPYIVYDLDIFGTCQLFTPTQKHTVTSIKLGLANWSYTYYSFADIKVELQSVDESNKPSGTVLATANLISGSSIPTSAAFSANPELTETLFGTPYEVQAGVTYAIVVSTVGVSTGITMTPIYVEDPYYPPPGRLAGHVIINCSVDLFGPTSGYSGARTGYNFGNETTLTNWGNIVGSILFEVYGEGDPPEKPDFVTPVDEAEDVEGSAGLEWLDPGAEQDNKADGFDLYFGSGSGSLGLVAEGLTAEQVTAFAKQVNDGQYYSAGASYQWRVDAFNYAGTTTGDIWTFSVAIQPSFDPDRPTDPEDPTNLDPDGRLIDDYDLTISGGGRHSRYLVVVGHKTVYIKKA